MARPSYKAGTKRDFELRIEYAPIGPGMRRRQTVKKQITARPREVARIAAKAVREGYGAVSSTVVMDGAIPVVRCDYSIRPRKPTRRVGRSWARCSIDPIFKRELR
jgi:hypothetical protein